MKLLIINPGATSTKIAVFEDEEQLFTSSGKAAAFGFRLRKK